MKYYFLIPVIAICTAMGIMGKPDTARQAKLARLEAVHDSLQTELLGQLSRSMCLLDSSLNSARLLLELQKGQK